jgi:hypothetical protein
MIVHDQFHIQRVTGIDLLKSPKVKYFIIMQGAIFIEQ